VVTSPNFNFWTEGEKVDHHAVTQKRNAPQKVYVPQAVVPDRELSPLLKPAAKKP
jgi:hypothetical protein